jgi:hypothetical protein
MRVRAEGIRILVGHFQDMRLPLVFLLIVGFAPGLIGQKIANVRASTQGSFVEISFDLIESEPGEKFRVSLYGSHDNFTSALIRVSGDAGDQPVKAGTGKKVLWDAASELRNFQGPMTFEVRAEVIPAPLVITHPAAGDRFKRESDLEITWSKQKDGRLELLKNGVSVTRIGEGSNGNMSWRLPSDVKPGRYQVKFASGGESVMSGTFKVAPRFPMALVAGCVAVVGAVAYIFFGGEKEESLPVPPNPQ